MSASDRRQRLPLTVQLSPAERAQLEAAAEAAGGLSLSGYAREVLLGTQTPGTRRRREKGADVAVLGELLRQLAKLGGNLNQLTRLAHQGQIYASPELADCLATVQAAAAAVSGALHDS